MKKLLATIFTIFHFFFLQNLNAQFGSTPEVISRSTATSLFQTSATDVDGDGDNDVLGTYQNCLVFYENLDGKGSFSMDRIFMELGFASYTPNLFGAKAADLDNDGLHDVAADRFWRKNLGGGNFSPRATIFTSSLAALCDVDGDNLPDAINLDNSKIYWQRNLGAGSFAARQVIKNAPTPNICCAKDLNFDGKMDLVARHSGGTFWYKNLGTNQFDTVRILNAQHVNLEFLDFDADGKMDIFTTNGKAIFWYEMDADGKTTLLQTVTTTLFEGGALAVGDMNNDGFPDIFAGSTSGLGERARYFPFNSSLGKFDAVPLNHNIYLVSHGWATFTNLDGDASPDILATTTYGFGWLKKITATQFSAVFNITQQLPIPKSIQSSDFENDGDLDLFAEGFVFRNLGNGNYAEKQKTVESGSRTFRGDLDGDGLKDLARPFGDSISWRKNLGAGQFSQPFLLPGLVTSCKEIGGGDLDSDGDLDLFACNGTDAVSVNARFYWFKNDGKGNFEGYLMMDDIQLCSGAFALDVNEDGKLDMVLTFFNKSAWWFPNLGGGNFDQPKSLFNGLPSPTNVNQTMLTDLDADGRIDYIYSTKVTTLTKVAWFRNLGNSTFAPEQTLVQMGHQGSYATPYFTVFDATLDGLPDLIVSDNYWNRFHLLPSAGNGKFGASKVVFDADDYGDFFGVVGHDVDGDGRLDLVFGNRTENITTQGYFQLSWLRNLHPQPLVPFAVSEKSATCSDNQTPVNAADDFLTISLKIKGFDNSSTRFVLSNFATGAVVDTFFYDEKIEFQLPPGSAGDGILKEFKIQDLIFQDTFLVVSFDAGLPCSAAAPAVILISDIKISCHDNDTPNDPTDDKLVFRIKPTIFNQPAPGGLNFFISSNLGWPTDTLTFVNVGIYGKENYFELPPGSATVAGKLILTLEDVFHFGIVRQFVFDHPGTCSGAPLPCPLSVFYHKQSEIDSFPIHFPGCRVLLGNLTVQELLPDAGVPSIENLLGFRQLLEVRGDVNISRTRLENLVGLDSLRLVGRDLNVLFFNNPSLESLVGLGGLQKIGQDFWLSDTAATLKNFVGVENLDSIGRDLFLWQMGGVTNFEGFESLKSAGIWAYQCVALENLKGLENVESAHAISMAENPNLKSLDGLQNLKTIAGDTFSVLQIARNPLLDDLSALDHAVSIPALEIWENPKLSVCAVEAICNYLKNFDPARTEIIDNLTDCNSVVEVQNSCTVSALDFSQGFDFQLFPNPISEGEVLQISLENDFFGTVKFEILSLDGRQLAIFEKEKTARKQVFEIKNLPVETSFFVRVSDEKRSAVRLVLQF